MALASGELSKDIASRLNVSPSYVSKVKTGKKVPSLKIIEPTLIKDEFFAVDSSDMTELLIKLGYTDLLIDKSEISEYIEVQMKKCIIRAKMYSIILDKLKGDK